MTPLGSGVGSSSAPAMYNSPAASPALSAASHPSSDLILPPALHCSCSPLPVALLLALWLEALIYSFTHCCELFCSVSTWGTICGKKIPKKIKLCYTVFWEREASRSHENWVWIYLAHPHRLRHRKVQADKSLLLPALVSEGRRGFLKSGQSPKCQIQGQHLKFSGDRVRQRQRTVTTYHQPRVCAKARETTHPNSSWSSRYNWRVTNISWSTVGKGKKEEKKPARHKRMARMLRQQHEA